MAIEELTAPAGARGGVNENLRKWSGSVSDTVPLIVVDRPERPNPPATGAGLDKGLWPAGKPCSGLDLSDHADRGGQAQRGRGLAPREILAREEHIGAVSIATLQGSRREFAYAEDRNPGSRRRSSISAVRRRGPGSTAPGEAFLIVDTLKRASYRLLCLNCGPQVWYTQLQS
jgi:hypothetical protein